MIVTFSTNVFVAVTNVCRNACAYCGFRARSPDDAFIVRVEDVERLFAECRGVATEALFSAGERPECAVGFDFRRMIADVCGEECSLVEYTVILCEIAIKHGLLPHTNIGVLSEQELMRLKDVNASMGLMLETVADIDAHRNSPGKHPKERLRTIEHAGRLKIPFTTGILVGIGEEESDRIASLEAIAAIHRKFGHIQEVIIQPFAPKANTPFANRNPPMFEEVLRCVKWAREILPDDVAIQAPPNLISSAAELRALIDAGVSDLGGISAKTHDYINPEAPWPSEKNLRRMIEPHILRERLPIYPKFIRKCWFSDKIRHLIEKYADSDGFKLPQKKSQ
ncbi:MAG: 7,8-didemethyl-8-hydroxy-5-deazariboflavin synthase subunit CofG [Canidatus Methanoxibalbensis ujae]|nr:7,8-didemethyl-8-hydroxy-5-deazariboflavin synthase subunit CofG [Candidatus Methanoxibalbensis ujae]MCW7078425.1 7,8-didemethyl-8-hydroxy-5-deazariboflavin synthase subunit CofG [Candidatus Methanoxibalbensis ujae]